MFMGAFSRAVSCRGCVFLADPAWGLSERAALAEMARAAGMLPATERGWLLVPSGGSSGRLKFARHDQDTVRAAVEGYRGHFGAGKVNCVGVLPLHHVSGLMAWMRAALSGGAYLPWNWKRLEAGERPETPGPGWFISLVPTQLQRLLSRPASVDWLREFQAVHVGGGPVWPDLADAAAKARLPISLGYGMTESAAMAAALLPSEFLSGRRDCGAAMPHARISLSPEGLIRLEGESLFRGYFPGGGEGGSLLTEDLGSLDSQGHLTVLGRRDDIVITGGRKVDPREVEAALRSTGLFSDIAVVGVPDPEWGQSVVACHPASDRVDPAAVGAALGSLAGYKKPRRYVPLSPWPRNDQGKLNRKALLEAAARTGP
jgi:o-succinylbenzoate---CoA ligase